MTVFWGLVVVLWGLFLMYGYFQNVHLSTSQARRRREIFESIAILDFLILFSFAAIYYIFSNYMTAGPALALAALVLVLGWIATKIKTRDAKKRKVFVGTEFSDLPPRRGWKVKKDDLDFYGYGVEPVFSADRSIARVEPKNISILEMEIRDLLKEGKEEYKESRAMRELLGRYDLEPENTVMKTEISIFRAVKRAIDRGEQVRLGQLLDYAKSERERRFIYFLMQLPARRFSPAALPHAALFARKGKL